MEDNSDNLEVDIEKERQESGISSLLRAVNIVKHKHCIEIIYWINKHDFVTVNNLAALLCTSQPRTSQALGILSELGVVAGEQAGMFKKYRLVDGRKFETEEMLKALSYFGGC